MTLKSEALWLYRTFQLSSSRLPDSYQIYSVRGAPPLLAAGAEAAPEVAVLPVLELEPPQAASRPARPSETNGG